MNSTALACTAALGLLFALGLAVSILRSRVGVLSGYAPEPDQLLTKLGRAHGNTAEYAPFFAVLFFCTSAPSIHRNGSSGALAGKLPVACSSWPR